MIMISNLATLVTALVAYMYYCQCFLNLMVVYGSHGQSYATLTLARQNVYPIWCPNKESTNECASRVRDM